MNIRERLSKPPTIPAAVCIVIGLFIGQKAVEIFRARNAPPIEQQLAAAAADVNKGLPKKLNAGTEMFSVTASGKIITYNSQLLSVDVASFDLDKFITTIRKPMTKGACETPATRGPILGRGVIMRYAWFDHNRNFIGKMDIRESDCDPAGHPLGPVALAGIVLLTLAVTNAIKGKANLNKSGT